ncbi:MAG: acyl transferase [Bacteroidales bacterium]|nr:acyl transferase [Bacteroidales bacterium]
MKLSEEIRPSVFAVSGEDDFNKLALKIFRYQYEFNPVYREMAKYLSADPDKITGYTGVPFLPVSLFRDHKVISGENHAVQKIFTSSGTTGSIPSKHFILDLGLYEESFMRSFMTFYGNPESYRFLALLPGYLERQDSSLVYMMDCLIRLTENNGSGFYLHDLESLRNKLAEEPAFKGQTMLFGASYALLDFAEQFPMDLKDIIVMETGGMKGRRREMIREELHEIICSRLNVKQIHSEYGMTELLSQAYSSGNGIFHTPPWMKILIRDTNDPMHFLPPGQTGGINIIDLANLYSCSFISTQDLGRVHEDGSFEVLGRFDDSDIRGCNLLVV